MTSSDKYHEGFDAAIDKAMTQIEYVREQTDSGEKCAAYDNVIELLKQIRQDSGGWE